MVMKMTIGQRIKNRRIELNLSVDEVAERLNKNRATIYRYEKDDIKELPITVLEPLAKVLETTPADLMGWESTPNEKAGEIMNHSKEFEFPLNIRSAARDLMDLSDSDQELAINMIHSLAKKGRKANKD